MILKSVFLQTKVLCSVFVLMQSVAFSQEFFRGKIVDSENGTPLIGVTIESITHKTITVSNNFGEFEIPEAGIYQFSKTGYQKKESEILNSELIIIQLEVNPSQLNEVIVTSNQIPQQLKRTNTTIDIISSKDIERSNSINVINVLNRVPGVFMQSGALNTNKISIRGIGSRNLYGTSKIRAYFKDIPLTSGNGETTIEDFELSSISRFEIIKGAGSSIYGAGLGGTIHLIPQSAYLNKTTAQSDISFGSFGLVKGVLNVNHGTSKYSLRAIYSNTHSDGFRDNNEFNRQTFTLNSNHYLSHKDDITLLTSYVDLKGHIPSSINETAFNNNPKSAAFTWAQAKGYEDAQTGIFGLSWNHQYNSKTKQITSVFNSFKNAYEPRPFNILKENTSAIGIRSRILGSFNKLEWTLGGEIFKDNYKSKTFENLYQDYPIGTGSIQGEKLSDLKEKRLYYNVFLETNYNISEKTVLTLGLNFNKTSYNLYDRFTTDANLNQSGSYTFKGIFSPKFGVSHLVSETISVYSNVSHGFSPPTTAETLLPDGLINTAIKPETGWNIELGSRTAFYNNRLQINLALYRLDIRNLLVAKRTGNDEFIGVNAGKTQHDGLEMVVKYEWLQRDAFSLNHYITYTLNNFKFKEFIDDGNNFSGNKLTGVPSNVFNTGIDFDTKLGIYTTINHQYIGRIPMTDNNSLFTDSYNLTNIKLGYKTVIHKNIQLNAYFGLDNVFNKHYASQILINATGFGGAAPRYYYPGNPTNYYTGLNVNYIF